MINSSISELKRVKVSGLAKKNSLVKKELMRVLLERNQPISVAECSGLLHVSFPTAKSLLDDLLNTKKIILSGKSRSGGRLANSYEINPNGGVFLGVQVDIDKIEIGHINLKKELQEPIYSTSFKLENTKNSLHKLVAIIKKNIDSNPILQKLLLGICIISPGRINTIEGKNKNYFNFIEEPLSIYLQKKLGFLTVIENDTRAMTLVEFSNKIIHHEKNSLFVNLNYGIGLGIWIEDKLYYGKNGYAGEWGHAVVFNNDLLCHCGKMGCLETGVSGNAFMRIVNQEILNGKLSQLTKTQNNSNYTLDEIISACLNGDILCLKILDEMIDKLGYHLAQIINVLNPEKIVIGGRLSELNSLISFPIQNALQKYNLSMIHQETKVQMSQNHKTIGLYGACLLVFAHYFKQHKL